MDQIYERYLKEGFIHEPRLDYIYKPIKFIHISTRLKYYLIIERRPGRLDTELKIVSTNFEDTLHGTLFGLDKVEKFLSTEISSLLYVTNVKHLNRFLYIKGFKNNSNEFYLNLTHAQFSSESNLIRDILHDSIPQSDFIIDTHDSRDIIIENVLSNPTVKYRVIHEDGTGELSNERIHRGLERYLEINGISAGINNLDCYDYGIGQDLLQLIMFNEIIYA